LIGLFSGAQSAGGIQVSGTLAWTAIVSRCSTDRGRPCLLWFGGPRSQVPALDHQWLHATSRAGAVLGALRTRSGFRAALVWHLDLLRLLPFFRLASARLAIFLHGIESWRPQHWLVRRHLRRASLFLSNSRYTWERFLVHNPDLRNAPHRVVPLGIGSPMGSSVTPVPSSPPVVLMISRLERTEDYKGHREVVDAWPMLLELVPDAELWVVGEGSLREAIERFVRERRVGERVRLLDRVSESQKEELLARCRCLAMPSRQEGFGLVYLEAMRMGRPCLVSDRDAGREVVNPPEAGLAVDPEDRAALADALARLLTPGPQWESWSRGARRRYESQFTAKHFQDRIVSALTPAAEWGLD